MTSKTAEQHRSPDSYSPAVDYDGFVVSPTLHLVHLHNSNGGLWSGTLAMRIPVLYLKLGHLMMSFAQLHVRSEYE